MKSRVLQALPNCRYFEILSLPRFFLHTEPVYGEYLDREGPVRVIQRPPFLFLFASSSAVLQGNLLCFRNDKNKRTNFSIIQQNCRPFALCSDRTLNKESYAYPFQSAGAKIARSKIAEACALKHPVQHDRHTLQDAVSTHSYIFHVYLIIV